MIRRDYFDERGIQRRVLVPDETTPLSEGIPISVPVDTLYDHMPTEFVVHLVNALFARNLIEPGDFFKAGAAELTRNAILEVCRQDALSIISLAKKHSQ